MARKAAAGAAVSGEEMSELVGEASTVSASAPPLGNFPDDRDVPLPAEAAPSDPGAGSEEAVPEGAEDTDAAPGPEAAEAPAPPNPFEQRLAELDQRMQALARENEFLRLAAQRGPQAAPPQTATGLAPELEREIGLLQVTDQDLNAILAGGNEAATTVSRAFQATAVIAARIAKQEREAWWQQEAARWTQAQDAKATALQAQQSFWDANKDLQTHQPIVGFFTQQVAQEQAQGANRPWDAVLREIATRTRSYLKQAGLGATTRPATNGTPSTAAAPGVGRRLRPAFAEAGTRSGARPINSMDRQMASLVGE